MNESQAAAEQEAPSSVEAWATDQQLGTLEVGQLDFMVASYRENRIAYEEQDKLAKEQFHKMKAAEDLVKQSLIALGKTKYFVDGLGTVSIVQKSSVTTPKSNEEKEALFGYIRDKFGVDGLTAMISVHSATLNSFVNKELDADPSLVIPGLTTPTVTTELRFRKD